MSRRPTFAQALYSDLAPFIEFLGYPHHWYSTADVEDDLVSGDGYRAWTSWLRRDDRVFLSNTVTGRGSAHRLTTMRSADQIVTLDHVRLAESGSHDQLLAAGGLYAHVWALRQRAATWKVRDRVHTATPLS